jgi:hypothetical protein
MGQSFFDKIQAKLELFRLEQRYTRRRHRRSTFVSNAVYVDGEYVYQTPSSTGGSSVESSNARIDALHGEKNVVTVIPEAAPLPSLDQQAPDVATAAAERKRLHRFSSIPSFGGQTTTNKESRVNRRLSMIR